MAKNKTKATDSNVADFLDKIENEIKRNDSFELIGIFKSITGEQPKMWGSSIIGFGSYHYKYQSGHEGDAPLAAFSPRKEFLVIYFASQFEHREALLSKLGKHKNSKACVYAKKLDDLNLTVLEQMIKNSIHYTTQLYPDRS